MLSSARILIAPLALAVASPSAQEQLTRTPESASTGAAQGGAFEPQRTTAPADLASRALSAEAQDTLTRINAHRAAGAVCGSRRYGPAAPLAWSQRLEQVAQAHAGEMAERRALSHSGGDGSTLSDRVARLGYNWAALGENVSAGYRSNPDALQGWMRSPGHCSNIMGPQFREVGLGAAHSTRDAYGWYRAMVLGSAR